MTQEMFEQRLARMGQKEFFDTFAPMRVKGQITQEQYEKAQAIFYKLHPEMHSTEQKISEAKTAEDAWAALDENIAPDPLQMDRALELSRQIRKENLTREEKILRVLSDGEKHHSSEFNTVVGWDWRKPMSDVCKTHNISKFPAGKFKTYQLVDQIKNI